MTPTLLELGWDTPFPLHPRTKAALAAGIAEVEALAPWFDGLVLDLYSDAALNNSRLGTPYRWAYNGFGGANLLKAADYRLSIRALAAVRFQQYRQNFALVTTQPGLLDWFDPRYRTVTLPNMTLMAQVARDTGCVGIFLDTEEYAGHPFTYFRQRLVARHTFMQYCTQVRAIGAEVMQALQRGFPGLEVLLSWGYGLAWATVRDWQKSLEQVPYGLLPSFLDGLLDATPGPIYDGCEQSYGFRTARQFDAALADLRQGSWSVSRKYWDYYRPSFGLWVDCYSHDVAHAWGKANWFTPAQWREALTAALARTGKYVWVYTEQPSWFTPEGMPTAYRLATRSVRAAREVGT
jgi:hypothetical protein